MPRGYRNQALVVILAVIFGASATFILMINQRKGCVLSDGLVELPHIPHSEGQMNNASVLCIVLSSFPERAVHVANTWSKRCSKMLFMGSKPNNQVDMVVLPVSEGRSFLWGKTKAALRYVYENHMNEFDWFLKADDDTYVIMDNLRHMLQPYSTETPIFFGLPFKNLSMNISMFATGGPGYILSRGALRRFIETALADKSKCSNALETPTGEDVEISRCLFSVGVDLVDTRDAQGKQKVFHFNPESVLTNATIVEENWQKNQRPLHYFEQIRGEGCCSDLPVSFHRISPAQMYFMEYMVYSAHAYGVHYRHPSIEEEKQAIYSQPSHGNLVKNVKLG